MPDIDAQRPRRIDVMLDIEAMGGDHDGAVVKIGACTFPRQGPLPTWEQARETGFDMSIQLQSCLNAGLKVQGRTVEWWLTQAEEARQDLLRDPKPLTDVLSAFRAWLHGLTGGPRGVVVWAKPAKFDCTLVEAAYQAIGKPAPWLKTNVRCLPSLMRELPVKKWPSRDVDCPVKHIALADAYRQTFDARLALDLLATIKRAAGE